MRLEANISLMAGPAVRLQSDVLAIGRCGRSTGEPDSRHPPSIYPAIKLRLRILIHFRFLEKGDKCGD